MPQVYLLILAVVAAVPKPGQSRIVEHDEVLYSRQEIGVSSQRNAVVIPLFSVYAHKPPTSVRRSKSVTWKPSSRRVLSMESPEEPVASVVSVTIEPRSQLVRDRQLACADDCHSLPRHSGSDGGVQC